MKRVKYFLVNALYRILDVTCNHGEYWSLWTYYTFGDFRVRRCKRCGLAQVVQEEEEMGI